MNKFLDFSDLFNFNDSVNNFLDDLRNLNNLLNDSGYNDYLFNNLFNFNNLRYFNHLLNDSVDGDSNFFNSFNGSWYFNDLFNNDLDRVVLSDEVVDWFFNFNDFVDFNNLINVSDDFNDLGYLSSLDYNLGGDFRYSNNLLLNDWYFNSSVNNLFNLLDHRNRMVDNLFNFFYPISVNNFLFNDFDFLDSWDFNMYLDNLLDSLGYFNNLFNGLDNRYWLFNDNFDDFRNVDDLVDSFFGSSPLDDFNWFLNNAVERLDDLDNLFDYLFLDDFNFNNFSDDFLDCDNLLLDNLNLFDLRNSMVDNLFNNHRFFNLNNLLLDHLDLDNLGDFNNPLDNLLDNSWDLNNLLSVLRYFDNFLNNVVNNLDDLNGDMNDLFNFLNLDDLDWFLNDSFNGDDLRNLNHSIYDLFNYLLNFNDFGDNSEDFQDIVNTDNSHDLSIDHTNDSLINVKDESGFSFDLFKFFEKSLDENSEVEFNSSRFITAVSVNILNSVEFRDVFDD